jgi:hypothetical protein
VDHLYGVHCRKWSELQNGRSSNWLSWITLNKNNFERRQLPDRQNVSGASQRHLEVFKAGHHLSRHIKQCDLKQPFYRHARDWNHLDVWGGYLLYQYGADLTRK